MKPQIRNHSSRVLCCKEEKEIKELYEDLACICDGLSPKIVITVLANMTANMFIGNKVDKDDFIEAMNEMYDILKKMEGENEL